MKKSQPSISGLLEQATALLIAAEVPSADVDAEILLAHVLDMSRGELLAHAVRDDDSFPVLKSSSDKYFSYVQRRANREPLQHILGVAWFRSLTLRVGPGVFVPRPETEVLAGMVIDALRAVPDPAPVAVDVGTGSGAIAIAVALEVPHSRVFALEKSDEAFGWVTTNADTAGVNNLMLVHGDVFGDDLELALGPLVGKVSVVVSNPPYIPNDAIPRDPEVRLFDPAEALYGGADGLDIVRELAVKAAVLVRAGGLLAIEHGEEQGEAVRAIFTSAGWVNAQTHPDLLGRDRYTLATHP